MVAASKVILFDLLYMRPLQWWLRTKGISSSGNPLRMIKVTRWCLCALEMWKKPWFMSQGPVLGAPCRRITLTTNASLMGWGVVMSGYSIQGLLEGPYLMWHINFLEMLSVFQALEQFVPDLRGLDVLVCTDNTSVVLYVYRQGGLRSRPLCRLECQILLYLNLGADILSRQGLRPGEWKLHNEVVEQIWKKFGWAQVDLFASGRPHNVPCGSPSSIQLRWGRMPWYRHGQGFSQVGGTIFHPSPGLCKMWVWPLRGHSSLHLVSQLRLLRPSSSPKLTLQGNRTLLNGICFFHSVTAVSWASAGISAREICHS